MSRHKKWILLDNYKRKIFLKNIIKKTLLKSIKSSILIPNYKRYLAYFYLIRRPKMASSVSFNNRCIVSGRVWSTNKKTELSRFELRSEVYKSNLPGLRRASW